MIAIKKSATADTRSCDPTKVTKEQLLESSLQHIDDVRRGITFFQRELQRSANNHDLDKVSPDGIAWFHSDFVTGFAQHGWWDNHRKINRHHLLQEDGIPADVNLIDVLDMIADCVMAGMGRTGTVYPLDISPELLKRAFDNTAKMLQDQVVVEED